VTDSSAKQTPAPTEGLSSKGARFVIVASRFNENVVGRLLEGARAAFDRTGTGSGAVDVVRVPGAFELPLAVASLADSETYDAVVALGCVIRGETSHFEHVSRAATDGLQRVSLEFGIPVGCGILTTDTVEQAMERSGGADGAARANRGFDAAIAAIEMVQLLKGS
jgi:6,7-dimethyl-8-ribityllumazine synthase